MQIFGYQFTHLVIKIESHTLDFFSSSKIIVFSYICNMLKIVFLDADTLGNASLALIEALGELVTYPRSTPEQGKERVGDAEVLIVNKFKVTEDFLECAPKLKLICEAATGVDNIDRAAAQKRGIDVRNVAAYSTDSVAQLTFTQILGLTLDAGYYDTRVKNGTYSRSGLFTDLSYPFSELSGKTLGIIGLGTIGQKVATIGEAFGMQVIYHPTSGKPHSEQYLAVSLDTLLSTSDVVSIHCPLNDATRGLVGWEQLCLMKRSAILVNAARGRIVDEAALARAISEERIAGAAVDVFSTEPLSADNPLLHTAHPERLRLTPHIAWTSREAVARLVEGIALNIKTFTS